MKHLFSIIFVLLPSMTWALGSRPSSYVPIKIKDVDYSGSGCPSGSASVTLSPDAKNLSVLFDKFTIENESSSLKKKKCNVEISVELPRKNQIIASDLMYRGFAAVPLHGFTQLRSETKIQDNYGIHSGVLKTKTFSGFFEGLFDLTFHPQVQSRQCGGIVKLLVNTELRAQAPSSGELTLIQVDSLDTNHKSAAELNFFLQVCR